MKITLGRTKELRIRCKPEVFNRWHKLIDDISLLKGNKVSQAGAMEHIFLPTLEEMTKSSMEGLKDGELARE